MLNLFQRPELVIAVLDNMQDGFAIVDEQGAQTFVNAALCRITGFTRDELTGRSPPFQYWPTEELAAIEAAFHETLAGEAKSYELTFLRKDGSRFPVIVSPSQLSSEDGRVLGHFATIKDISERKRLEQALASSEQRWRSIAENPFDFVVVIDRHYRYTFVNHTAPGITPESLIGRATPFDFADERYHPAMLAAFETTFSTGRAASYDVHVPQLDAWYMSVVGPIFEAGQVTSASILTRNITAQKRAEEALLRSESQLREKHKMETVGTLAGGIAHDLNNMLTPILGFSEIVQQALTTDHPQQHELRNIVAAATRARDLVQQLLLFSRRGEPHKHVLDLRECLAGDLKLLMATSPPNVEWVVELPKTPVYVLADRTQMSRVVTNLTTNGLQAMREAGGRLEVTLRTAELAVSEPLTPRDSAAQPYVVLSVRDTGPGMDAETRRRAFEPFFTTKPTGTGTGLGLSIVHGIVSDHGGSVTLDSSPGIGALFTVRLPLAPPPALAGPSTPSGREEPRWRALRLLCVDDEMPVIALLRSALESAGHHVTAFCDPCQALASFKSTPDAFDLVITDQAMSGLTGLGLIQEIRAVRPLVPCMMITGFEDSDTEQRATALGVIEIVHKPFSVDRLRASVERAGLTCKAR